MNKKIVISFLSITLAVVLMLAGVNWYIDPHKYFRVNSGSYKNMTSSDFDANERMLAAYKLENEDGYDGIIIGGSKTRPLTEKLFSHYTGLNYLSCVADCGTFDTYEKLINFAIDHQDLKQVIIHLSGRETFEGVQDDIDNRMPAKLLGSPQLKDTAYYMFTDIKDTVLDSDIPSPKARFSVQKPVSHDPKAHKDIAGYLGILDDEAQLGSWIGEARMETASVRGMKKYYKSVCDGDGKEEWTKEKVLGYYGTYDDALELLFEEEPELPYLDTNIESLRRIKKTCDENGIELTVIIGSVSMIERAKYEGYEYWEYLRQIAQITDFYDFSYFCDINNDPYNFLNGNHNLDSISWVIVGSVYGYDPYDYGKYITKDNIEQYLDERRTAYYTYKDEYERTGTVKLPGMGDKSDLSVLPAEFFSGF